MFRAVQRGVRAAIRQQPYLGFKCCRARLIRWCGHTTEPPVRLALFDQLGPGSGRSHSVSPSQCEWRSTAMEICHCLKREGRAGR